MGKGIIKSGGADGFYNVEITLERDRIGETIATIDANVESLTSVIDTMDEGTEKELLKLERNSYIKKKEYLLNNMIEDPIVSAWCADLTEDITGNVGTIEVPGERGVVQIQPGYEGNSTHDATRDGQLQPSIASTPAATFYNLAMLPGWQKWKPTYRYGVISNIDTDANTCDVKLDEVESSQQNLDINQEINLVGVPVSYMSCDSSAFENGDNVLVEFIGQDWSDAHVIGFRDNPKACGFQFKLTRGDEVLITESSGLLSYIKVYNSNDVLLSTTTPKYSTETEYWSFDLVNPGDADIDGYWIDYLCEDGISTQYPYRYKTDDKDKEADLVFVGEYEDIIPFWNVAPEIYDPEPVYTSPHPYCIEDEFVIATDGGKRWWLTKTGFSMNEIVKSSIPFKAIYKIRGHYAVKRTGEHCIPGVQAEYTAISDDGFLDFNYSYPVTPTDVVSDWIEGDISGKDAKITITITSFAEDYNCTQMWIPFSHTRPWDIYVTYEDYEL